MNKVFAKEISMKTYLCIENGEYFTVEAKSLAQAKEYALIWGGKAIRELNEGRVKQFEMDYASMVKDIKRGYGWIDPEYVADTWENSSDSIGFDLVRDEIFDRLIAAGLLAHADSNDPEKAGKYIKSAKDLYVMENENE
jgi:hypothetical protein